MVKTLRAGAARKGKDELAMMIGRTNNTIDVSIDHNTYISVYPVVDAIKPMINMVISETPTDDIQYVVANMKKIQIELKPKTVEI